MNKILIKLSIIVYINHSTIVFIIQQTKLSSFLIDKLNFRLIKISIYLFQFFLKAKHKLNNQHVMLNTFSRLFIDAFKFVVNNFVFDDVY